MGFYWKHLAKEEEADTEGQLDALKLYLKTVLQINEQRISIV